MSQEKRIGGAVIRRETDGPFGGVITVINKNGGEAVGATDMPAVYALLEKLLAGEPLEELRRACAGILGADPERWPSHGNASLAIAGALACATRAPDDFGDSVVTAARVYIEAAGIAHQATIDGINVHGALSGLIGARDNLETALLPNKGPPRLLGWRTDNYLMETSSRDVAVNWENHHKILPVWEGDPNTKLTGAT